MSLSAGDRLGPYEIVAAIGAGGMGEVYRARDSRLRRDVAIKVLPSAFTADSERLSRFELEAHAAGSLNHPNILAVHDVGTHDGTAYVVSELLEGETLRQRLAGALVPPRKAIEYAIQIARGLAAAHAKGVVHRDIKPENLFVTSEGHVKILDFGLAKISATKGADIDATSAATEAMGTQPGMVMGTVGYMSPEQVRGLVVDSRSDIFSLGVVLYEMLTGKRPFHGDSSVETLSAILRDDPPQMSESVSEGLRQIVTHCLEKEPLNRFQSARDLAFALETIAVVNTSKEQAALTKPRRQWLRSVVAGVLIFAVAFASWLLAKRTTHVAPRQFQQVTFRRGYISGGRFAGDGHTIIYSAAWDGKPAQLFSTLESSPESRPLGIADAHVAAISRTGEMALLLSSRPFLWLAPLPGTLARAPVSGGSPREVAENVTFADWSPDGNQLAIVRVVPGGQVLEFPVGKSLYETAGQIVMPKVSPNGDLVAFMEEPLTWDGSGAVTVVDAAGKKRVISRKFWNVCGLAWSPGGRELWFIGAETGTQSSLYAADLRGNLRLDMHLPGMYVLMDIAPDGRALLMHDAFIASMNFHPAGSRQETNLYWHDNSIVRDLSPDGSQILFSEGAAASTNDWVTFARNTNGSPAVRLGQGLATAFSADGKWAMTNPSGPQAPLIAYPTHAGVTRTLAADAIRHFAGRWLDAQRIVFVGAEPGHRLRYYVQEPGHNGPRAISGENIDFDRGDDLVLSPDGKSVAATTDQGVQLLQVDGGTPREVPATSGLTPAAWCRDGGLLAYHRGEMPAHILRIDIQSGRQQGWKDLVPLDQTALTQLGPIRFTSDCDTYAYSLQYDPSTLFVVSRLQ